MVIEDTQPLTTPPVKDIKKPIRKSPYFNHKFSETHPKNTNNNTNINNNRNTAKKVQKVILEEEIDNYKEEDKEGLDNSIDKSPKQQDANSTIPFNSDDEDNLQNAELIDIGYLPTQKYSDEEDNINNINEDLLQEIATDKYHPPIIQNSEKKK